MFITFYGLLFVSFGWTMSISKVEPSGLVNPFLIYTPFCAFNVTVYHIYAAKIIIYFNQPHYPSILTLFIF